MEPFVPTLVHDNYTDLRARFPQHPPNLLRLDNGWRVTLTSDRVTLVMEWRRASPRASRLSYHSTLTVDGQRRALARDIDHFTAIWNNPDTAHDPIDTALLETRPTVTVPDLGPVPDEVTVPAVVERMLHPAGDPPATLGYRDGRWQLLRTSTALGHLAQVYLEFTPDEHGRYKMSPGFMTGLLVIDNRDCTSLADKIDLSLFGLELPTSTPDPNTPGGARHAQQGKRANSVEVRRATVIRT